MKQVFIAAAAALSVTACMAPDAPEVIKAVQESATAQKGVCPGQTFGFIASTENGDMSRGATGFARVERTLPNGSTHATIMSQWADSSDTQMLIVPAPGIATKPASQCGPYTPKG